MNDTNNTPSSNDDDSSRNQDAEIAAMNEGVWTLKLFRPLTVNGEALGSIKFDFTGLSEQNLADIERDLKKGSVMQNVLFSHAYCMCIAAQACGINRNDLKRLSAKDSYKIITAVQIFFGN